MRAAFLQAYREARANGRIGYCVLRNPRARIAAAEVLCMRQTPDAISRAKRRYIDLQRELFWRATTFDASQD